MILKIHPECRYILSMSEFLCQHILYICPYAEKDKSGGAEGGKVYTFGRSLHWKSKNFTSKAIGATRKKLMWKKSEV